MRLYVSYNVHKKIFSIAQETISILINNPNDLKKKHIRYAHPSERHLECPISDDSRYIRIHVTASDARRTFQRQLTPYRLDMSYAHLIKV